MIWVYWCSGKTEKETEKCENAQNLNQAEGVTVGEPAGRFPDVYLKQKTSRKVKTENTKERQLLERQPMGPTYVVVVYWCSGKTKKIPKKKLERSKSESGRGSHCRGTRRTVPRCVPETED